MDGFQIFFEKLVWILLAVFLIPITYIPFVLLLYFVLPEEFYFFQIDIFVHFLYIVPNFLYCYIFVFDNRNVQQVQNLNILFVPNNVDYA